MKLIEQLQAALESDLPAEQVRVWLWIKLVRGGNADIMDTMSQFVSDYTLSELIRIKLVSVQGTRLIAENWGVGSKVEVTDALRRREKYRSIHHETEIHDSPDDTNTPENHPKAAKLDPTPKRRAPEKVISGKLSKLSGRERLLAAFTSPRASGSKEAQEEAAEWVFRRMNAARKRFGLHALPVTQFPRYRVKLKEVARFVLENDAKIDDFLEWAKHRTEWQKVGFPTPNVLAGPWLQGEWTSRAEHRSRHAGHSYAKAADDDLRSRLTGAGFKVDSLGDEELDFIAEEAVVLRDHPEHYTPDPDWHELVKWVVEHEEIENGTR